MAPVEKPVTKKEDPAPVKAQPVTAKADDGTIVESVDGDTVRASAVKSADFFPPFSVRVDGRTYFHVGEDAEGHWIYRFIR